MNYAETTAGSNAEAAKLFATFFESVFTHVALVRRSENLEGIPAYDICLPLIQLSTKAVQNALEDLDSNKGHPSLVKTRAGSLAKLVSVIFNRSLIEGVLSAI